MVRITREKIQQQSRRRGAGGSGLDTALHVARAKLLEVDSLVGVLIIFIVFALLVGYVLWSTHLGTDNLRAGALAGESNHPNLHLVDKNSEQYNAIALDILQTLDCHKLLNETKMRNPMFFGDSNETSSGQAWQRRLDEGFHQEPNNPKFGDSAEFGQDSKANPGIADDDAGLWEGGEYNPPTTEVTPTAKHLFCLAAYASDDQKETKYWKDAITCDATGMAQKSLLDLWSAARGEMETRLLLKILDLATESLQTIAKKDLYLWAPIDDTGSKYMLTHVNDAAKTVDQGGLYGMGSNLGQGKVFVDVGSCLGTTSMAVALLYPGTRIISVEVASPNWLLQEVSFRCNANAFPEMPLILYGGVGPAHATTTFARYMWKPDQVTTARSWSKNSEINLNTDEELSVRLRPWHAILAEAEIPKDPKTNRAQIDVLNVDCGGCEYNLIPSMSNSEFDYITTVMGGLHWGYIPKSKLPSSMRGKETHERLCRHENFASTAKECCEFPNMEVISSLSGTVLVENEGIDGPIGRAGKVRDVAGDLCNDYAQWAVEKRIHDIPSDWGWFQLTATAPDE